MSNDGGYGEQLHEKGVVKIDELNMKLYRNNAINERDIASAEFLLNEIERVLGKDAPVYKNLNAIIEKNRPQTPSAVSTPPVATATVPARPSMMSRFRGMSMFGKKKEGGSKRKKRVKRKTRR